MEKRTINWLTLHWRREGSRERDALIASKLIVYKMAGTLLCYNDFELNESAFIISGRRV
jgi:hypothetical protein